MVANWNKKLQNPMILVLISINQGDTHCVNKCWDIDLSSFDCIFNLNQKFFSRHIVVYQLEMKIPSKIKQRNKNKVD